MEARLFLVLIVLVLQGATSEIIQLNGPQDCPVHHVTVYSNRAEVSRHVSFMAKEEGDLTVEISDLTRQIDANALRVASGMGDATLLEVSHKSIVKEKIEEDEKRDPLIRELQEVDYNISILVAEEKKLTKQMGLLEVWANKQAAREQSTLDSSNFLDIYEKRTSEWHPKLREVESSLKTLRKSRQQLEKEISACTRTVHTSVKTSVSILLHVNEPIEINLLLSYVVWLAEWTPKYDIRVNSDTMKTQITYYGTIINNSEDDWNDVSLSLSTATTTSTDPPTLDALKVDFEDNTPRGSHYAGSFGEGEIRRMVSEASARYMADVEDDEGEAAKESLRDIPSMTSYVMEGMSAAHFNIPRKANIPADGIAHKVAITILDLPCHLLYEVFPKFSSRAYLKANVTNNSNYPLLAGTANVFLDNNYVSQIHLKYIPGNEKLEISLGIDNSITVERKADKVQTTTTGYLVQNTIRTYTHESVIKNTKKIAVPIKVYEQVPKSQNDKIKVQLRRPDFSLEQKDKKLDVSLNEDNILVWDIKLAQGETKSFVAEYQVEYPAKSTVAMHT